MKNMEESDYKGGGLADDMGLGKTLQTILTSIINGVSQTLIVCPSALTTNWKTEIETKTNLGLKVFIYHGLDRRQQDLQQYHVIITTYRTLLIDHMEPHKSPVFKTRWRRIVLDESQNVKNYQTKSAQACFDLKSTFRWCLSGTPVQNHMDDLYAALRFLRVQGYTDFQDFTHKVVFDGHGPDVVDRVFLRRHKDNVLNLHPKTIIDYPCDMEATEKREYLKLQYSMTKPQAQQAQQQARQQQEGPPPSPPRRRAQMDFSRVQRMRMACNDVYKVVGKEGQPSKALHVVKLVKSIVNKSEKVVVFSHFLRTISSISTLLQTNKISHVTITGATNTASKRDPIIASFKLPSGPSVLVIQTMVGGVGLNLTEASSIVLVEPWWNPCVDDQAMDRAHRIGQTRPVTVYRCFVPKTIEERMLLLQEKKREMVKEMWGHGPGARSSNGLTKKDIRYLLQGK